MQPTRWALAGLVLLAVCGADSPGRDLSAGDTVAETTISTVRNGHERDASPASTTVPPVDDASSESSAATSAPTATSLAVTGLVSPLGNPVLERRPEDSPIVVIVVDSPSGPVTKPATGAKMRLRNLSDFAFPSGGPIFNGWLFDAEGRRVSRLAPEHLAGFPGLEPHGEVERWVGASTRDDDGNPVPPGTYDMRFVIDPEPHGPAYLTDAIPVTIAPQESAE